MGFWIFFLDNLFCFTFLSFGSFLFLYSTEIEAIEQNDTWEGMCSLNVRVRSGKPTHQVVSKDKPYFHSLNQISRIASCQRWYIKMKCDECQSLVPCLRAISPTPSGFPWNAPFLVVMVVRGHVWKLFLMPLEHKATVGDRCWSQMYWVLKNGPYVCG